MRCVICKQANTEAGEATVTLERDALTLVIKNVPAQVCPNCGEEYVDQATTAQLFDAAETAARSGIRVDVREYAAA